MIEDIFGGIAATLTTVSFIPQAVKTIRTRETEGISLWMYIIFATGVACWLVYGIMLRDLPMMFANSITLPLVLSILAIKIRAMSFKKIDIES